MCIKKYRRNKAIRNKDIDNKNRKILIWAKKLKAANELGGKCELCGEEKIWLLCFHHKDPNEKEDDINILKSSKVRFTDLMHEVNKCQLLCQNCHREVHKKLDNENERQRVNKKICMIYKNKDGCEKCNYKKCDYSMEFHHTNPLIKDVKISKLINNHSWKSVDDLQNSVKNELDKCIVICRNCHQTIHQDVEFITHNWNKIFEKSKMLTNKNIVDSNKVIELCTLGFDRFKISKHLSCSPGRVYEILKANGLIKPRIIIDREKILDLYKAGIKICNIVKHTHYSKSTVLKTIKEYKNESNTRAD